MAVFIALLRAVNVGGTGKLLMSELRALCEGVGLENVTTYIQSGNVVFTTRLGAASAKKKLEAALAAKMGKPVGVHLRTPAELSAILERNPFEKAAPQQVIVLFLEQSVSKSALAKLKIEGGEQVEPAGREVFVHYPDGMGRSKLKLPFAAAATGRNLNTVQKLLDLGREASGES